MSDYPRLLWNLLSSPTAPEPPPSLPEAVEPAAVHDEHGLKCLTLQGSAYALGWQQGYACRPEIQALVAGFYARFAQGWGAWLYRTALPPRLYYLWQFVPPRYQAELWGVAQGAALPLRDILLINFFDDVLNLLELGWASACSCTLVRDRRGSVEDQREGQILLGRNLDYNSAVGQLVRPYQVLLRRYPNQGQASISLGVVGQVGVLTAMNAAGLSLGSLTSPSRERTWQGLGVSFIYRRMLDQASTVQAALACLQARNQLRVII